MSYEIRRGVVDLKKIDDVLRLIHINWLICDEIEIGRWVWSRDWFPHLKYAEEIHALADSLPFDWKRKDTKCDPQIILQFPHTGTEPEITMHTDKEPDWAEDRRYSRIVGVPLSRWTERNGSLILVRSYNEVEVVELDPGDAIVMSPDQPHSAGINRTGEIRYGVYFRWLS